MTLAETFAPKKYRLHKFVIERTDAGVEAYITVEVLTESRCGLDTVRLPVSLTTAQKTMLRQKIVDRLAQFEADEGVVEIVEPGAQEE